MPGDIDVRLVFQRRLKLAREERQLSQKNLGIQADIDSFVASTRINRYELGVHEPDMATVQRLAVALKVPVAYLFATDDRLAAMILAFDRLTVLEKDRLLRNLSAK